MFKHVFLWFFLFTISMVTEAQRANVGVKGGLNFSTHLSTLPEPSKNYHAGVFFKYDVSRKFTLQAESIYSVIQFTANEESYQKGEFEFPVLVKFFAVKPFYFQMGWQGDLTRSVSQEEGQNLLENQKYTHSYVGGVGFNLPSGFDLSVRYLYASHKIDFHKDQIQISIGFDIY